MYRVNPYIVRISKSSGGEYWVVSGDYLRNPNAKKYDDEIKIYRILIKKE